MWRSPLRVMKFCEFIVSFQNNEGMFPQKNIYKTSTVINLANVTIKTLHLGRRTPKIQLMISFQSSYHLYPKIILRTLKQDALNKTWAGSYLALSYEAILEYAQFLSSLP